MGRDQMMAYAALIQLLSGYIIAHKFYGRRIQIIYSIIIMAMALDIFFVVYLYHCTFYEDKE